MDFCIIPQKYQCTEHAIQEGFLLFLCLGAIQIWYGYRPTEDNWWQGGKGGPSNDDGDGIENKVEDEKNQQWCHFKATKNYNQTVL